MSAETLTGLVISDPWTETVHAEVWRAGRRVGRRAMWLAPQDAPTVAGCIELALDYMRRMGITRYRVTEDLEAAA